jgi:hypothetical protein
LSSSRSPRPSCSSPSSPKNSNSLCHLPRRAAQCCPLFLFSVLRSSRTAKAHRA